MVPLVFQSRDWQHGVFLGSIMASETTAAAAGAVGNLRRDPFAMLPFCGYNMADYFAHWLSVGAAADPDKLPKIFYVNWFRKDENGQWLWPGYGENSRVLEWVFERVSGTARRSRRRSGYVPAPGAIDTERARRLRRGHGEAAHRRRRRMAGRGAPHPRALRHLRRPAAAGSYAKRSTGSSSSSADFLVRSPSSLSFTLASFGRSLSQPGAVARPASA